jgi:hypothetical protein
MKRALPTLGLLTGSLVFLQSWADPSAKGMLDAFVYSFRWNPDVKPPVCELLDPR